MMLATTIFWITLFLIGYVYAAYPLLLSLIVAVKGKILGPGGQHQVSLAEHLPGVTVIIAAHNEEDIIIQRLDNLMVLDYPNDKLEIIVASDGSSDRTVEIARSYNSKDVKVLDFQQNRGRAAVHNDAVVAATGDIIVFSDAETRFAPHFLRKINHYFSNKSVGCVVGNLVYITGDDTMADAEGLYWKFEKMIRKLESDLGILATASGACMAVRKRLWKELDSTDDVDFITPLDVIVQGFRVRFAPEALAYDFPPQSVGAEFRTRIRQTSKNLTGTLRRWSWQNWILHPFVSWSLLSHKLLRWMTPYLLLAIFMSTLLLYDKHWIYTLCFLCLLFSCFLSIVGYFAEKRGLIVPFASPLFAFFVANLGMAIGVFNALTGRIPAVYKKAD